MSTIDDFERLKSKFARKQQEHSEKVGRIKSLLERLKEYGFDSIEEGQTGLNEMQKDLKKLEKKRDKKYKDFINKYGEFLDE